MEINSYSLYIHTFPNGKKYVGITSLIPEKRWLKGRGYTRHILIKNAIKKYGWENINHDVVMTGMTREEACQREIQSIAILRTTDINYGYNLNCGGDLKIPNSETLAKISGKNHWNYGNPHGFKHTDETKRKLSEDRMGANNANYGKTLTEEHKQKLSKRMSGDKNPFKGKKHKDGLFANRRKPIIQKDIITNKIIKVWDSAWEIEMKLGISHSNIARCCRGKIKKSHGYVWEYAQIKP